MGLTSTQSFKFKLVADGVILDLFKDEEIKLSDNITGLFDLGVLPSDFTRTITLPGTKKNNHFFEFVYDISVINPYTFSTNQKVSCYLDFDGIYLSNGYMQLNKVNVYQNKFIDSYEVTIYGGLSSFGRDLKRYFLTDLGVVLSQYNHTSSFANISSSWGGNLFNGDIVYPLAEYGQKIQYNSNSSLYGIQSPSGALCVQDFKPAIRVKKVFDACFEQFGYTYSSSFMNEAWWDNVYMICNNQLRYPIYPTSSYSLTDFDIETYGQGRIGSLSGSGFSNITMSAGVDQFLPWYNVQSNPANNFSTTTLEYTLDLDSKLRGNLNLNFQISASGFTVPQFELIAENQTTTTQYSASLTNYNNYMQQVLVAGQTNTQTFELLTGFDTPLLPAGPYKFYLNYTNYPTGTVRVVLDPNDQNKSYLEITKVNQAGEGLLLDIANNMPYGTAGIKLIDFISAIQKKFNLVIYPNKTKLNEFIIEPFNRWYKTGTIKNFNKYINLNDKISVTPANNLAVQNLNFGDTLDGDYISQQFSKAANREFGKAYYVDTENFFSQGNFEVKTTLASSPLVYLAGTGISGSVTQKSAGFSAFAGAVSTTGNYATANSSIRIATLVVVSVNVSAAPYTSDSKLEPITGYQYRNVGVGTQIVFDASTTGTSLNNWQFNKETDSGTTTLADQSSAPSGQYFYTVTAADLASTILNFSATAQGEST